MSEAKKEFMKNSLFSYLGKFAPIIFSFIYTIILAEALGANDYGLFTYLTAIGVGFLNLFGSNFLYEILSNFTAQSGSRRLFKIILSMQFLLTTAVFIGLIIFGNDFLAGMNGSSTLIVLIALALIFFNPLISSFEGLYEGAGKFGRPFVGILAEHLVNLGMIIFFVHFMGLGLMGALIAKYISLGFHVFVYFIYYRKMVFKEKPIEMKVVKKYFFSGIGGEFVSQLGSQINTVAMGFISPAVLGVYYIADKICSIALGAPSSSTIEVIAQSNSSNFADKKKIEKYTSLSTKVAFFIVVIFSVLLFFLAYPLLAIFFPKYVDGIVFIPLLAIEKYFKSLDSVKTILISLNKAADMTIQKTICTSAMIASIIILVPVLGLGILGLIIARVITVATSVVSGYVMVRRHGIKIDLVPRKSDAIFVYNEGKMIFSSIMARIFQKKK